MAVSLSSLLVPTSTAVLTMEVQRGVCGDLASLPELASAARESGAIENTGRLCAAARAAGARVVHCTAVFRPDRAGSKGNARILAGASKLHGHLMDIGEPGAQVVPELGPEPSDIEVSRLHGLSPFTSTALDQILRNLGVTTVIATGVSMNVGIIGMVISAVDLGYQVVVPRDAVAAVPPSYGEAMFENSFAMLATLCTTSELVAAWQPSRQLSGG